MAESVSRGCMTAMTMGPQDATLSRTSIHTEAAMTRKAPKKSAKRTLKLRKKPLRDLPVKAKANVKGGMQRTLASSLKGGTQKTFAPPYVPVGPVVGGDN